MNSQPLAAPKRVGGRSTTNQLASLSCAFDIPLPGAQAPSYESKTAALTAPALWTENPANITTANRMRISIIGFCLLTVLLTSGCATSHRSSRSGQDGELDTATRLAAIEIRLEKVDEKLAVIQAYETGIYVVRAGDTAAAIAQALGMPLADLEELNPTAQWNRLRVGQRIKIRKDVSSKALEATAAAPGS